MKRSFALRATKLTELLAVGANGRTFGVWRLASESLVKEKDRPGLLESEDAKRDTCAKRQTQTLNVAILQSCPAPAWFLCFLF